jgi:hypothetical protein
MQIQNGRVVCVGACHHGGGHGSLS